jgi:hypothetical protein
MMRSNIPVLVLAAILLSGVMPAQAEHEWEHRYVIEGKVLSPDGEVIRWMTVEIDCSEEATDSSLCGNNEERDDRTGFSGNYELILHIHSGDHGKRIVIDVNGQKFEHIIDLQGADGQPVEADRYVTDDLQLDSDPGLFRFVPLVSFVALIVGSIAGLVVKMRGPKSSTESRATKSRSSSGDFIDCPHCKARLRARNAAAHMLKVHRVKDYEIPDEDA